VVIRVQPLRPQKPRSWETSGGESHPSNRRHLAESSRLRAIFPAGSHGVDILNLLGYFDPAPAQEDIPMTARAAQRNIVAPIGTNPAARYFAVTRCRPAHFPALGEILADSLADLDAQT
jgi:hypothetical protein